MNRPMQDICGLCCTKIEDFSVQRGGHQILDHINMHVHCGELTAVIGPNGGGKSTLLKAILGEIPHEGVMHYLDVSGGIADAPVIGYVPQYLDFDQGSPLSVLDLFTASRSKRPVWVGAGRKMAAHATTQLSMVQAEHLINRRLGALSGGELQRVLLALALDPIPDLLLLDEPVSGMDHKGMELFYRLVSDLRHQHDLSIILVSHDLGLMARYADRIVFLNQTVRVVGHPREVFAHPEVIDSFGHISVEPASQEILLPEKKGGDRHGTGLRTSTPDTAI